MSSSQSPLAIRIADFRKLLTRNFPEKSAVQISTDTLRALIAENDELRKNAGRYVHLRACPGWFKDEYESAEKLDQEVDKSMRHFPTNS
jgi:hypothetical protein